jgi:hypothetical protein
VTALDKGGGDDAPKPVPTPQPEIGVERSADLQSSRVPPVDTPPANRPEPFYREAWLGREDLAKITDGVDARIASGEARPDQRSQLIAEAKDTAFATKARDGDFYSLSKYGTLESTMQNATPPHWYGGGAEGRLYEVTPTPGTTYYVGRAAPQDHGQRHADDPARGVVPPRGAADVSGGGLQAFVPRDTNRAGWEARPVARSEAELAALPSGSAVGYDAVGDITVTPESAHASDQVVAVHRVGNGNPFEKVDSANRAYAAENGENWSGPTADKFAGSIEERVTPLVPADHLDVTRR